MSRPPPRVLFMGSPAFAVPSLESLVAAGYSVVAAVTQPDRPAGRGGQRRASAVSDAAAALGVPVLAPVEVRSDEAVRALAALAPDVIVVAAYGKILPRALLAAPARGNINVHASLLPRWRGASPIAAAILAGDTFTGVSVMEMVPKMDAGPVVASRRVPIDGADTTATLEPRLAAAGAELLVEVLPAWLAGEIAAVPQNDDEATYCGLLRKEDGFLRRTMSAAEAERATRAYTPWPGAHAFYGGRRLAVWSGRVAPGDAPAGMLEIRDGRPAIAFARGFLILEEVQLPGGRRIDGRAFLNGERGKLERQVVLA